MRFYIVLIIYLTCYLVSADVVPKIKLNTGHEIPVIGLGTWQAKGAPVVRAVRNALEAGYRHIDTAWLYENEKDVGKAIDQSIKKGIVKREDIFITTKVWPQSMETREESYNIIKNSLNQLNTSYIDLVLIHWPNDKTNELYKGLEKAYNQKLVRSIGVSNYNINELKDLIKNSKVKPAMNQIRIHPKLNQEGVVQYCKKNGIAVTGYSPLGTGQLIGDKTLTNIGKKHNKTSAQVMIRWQIDRGLIVIPKSVHKKRIIENFDVFDYQLRPNEVKTINNMTQLTGNSHEFWT